MAETVSFKDQGCSNDNRFTMKKLIGRRKKSRIIVPRQRVKIRQSPRHKFRMFMRKRNPTPFIAKKCNKMKTKVAERVNSVTEKIHDKFTDIAFEIQMMSFENPFSRDFYEDHCTIL